jgi:hypothetical protein
MNTISLEDYFVSKKAHVHNYAIIKIADTKRLITKAACTYLKLELDETNMSRYIERPMRCVILRYYKTAKKI